jgi:hypothetical protein
VTTLTIGIGRRLVAEHDDNERQRLQCAYVESHPIDPEDEDGRAEEQLSDAHDDAGDRKIADLPRVRRCRWPDIIGRQRHAKEIACDHDKDHQQGR